MVPIKLEIPKELFSPAEFHTYSEHADIGSIELGGVDFDFPAGVDWTATITNTGGAFLVTGSVTGTAKTDCVRCLEDATLEVEGEIEGYYLISPDAEVPDDMEEDEFERLGDDKVIDMAPLINAALVLELPQTPLCKEDCAGLCPTCGQNLNVADCNCPSEIVEDSSNPFSVLKDFNFS